MGLFGGEEDNQPSQSELLMEEQYRTNQEELEMKKQSLYKQRLAIIKGQGGQNWTPDYSSPVPPRYSGSRFNGEFSGTFGRALGKAVSRMGKIGKR